MGSLGCPLCCRQEFVSVGALHDHLLYYIYRPLKCALCGLHVGGIQELTRHLECHLTTPNYRSALPDDENVAAPEHNVDSIIENAGSTSTASPLEASECESQVFWPDKAVCRRSPTRTEPVELHLRAYFCQTCESKVVGKDAYLMHMQDHSANMCTTLATSSSSHLPPYHDSVFSGSHVPRDSTPPFSSMTSMPDDLNTTVTSFRDSIESNFYNSKISSPQNSAYTDTESTTTEESQRQSAPLAVDPFSDYTIQEIDTSNQLLKLREWQLEKQGKRFKRHQISFASSVRSSNNSRASEGNLSCGNSPVTITSPSSKGRTSPSPYSGHVNSISSTSTIIDPGSVERSFMSIGSEGIKSMGSPSTIIDPGSVERSVMSISSGGIKSMDSPSTIIDPGSEEQVPLNRMSRALSGDESVITGPDSMEVMHGSLPPGNVNLHNDDGEGPDILASCSSEVIQSLEDTDQICGGNYDTISSSVYDIGVEGVNVSALIGNKPSSVVEELPSHQYSSCLISKSCTNDGFADNCCPNISNTLVNLDESTDTSGKTLQHDTINSASHAGPWNPLHQSACNIATQTAAEEPQKIVSTSKDVSDFHPKPVKPLISNFTQNIVNTIHSQSVISDTSIPCQPVVSECSRISVESKPDRTQEFVPSDYEDPEDPRLVKPKQPCVASNQQYLESTPGTNMVTDTRIDKEEMPKQMYIESEQQYSGAADELNSQTTAKPLHSDRSNSSISCDADQPDILESNGRGDAMPYLHKKFHHDQERKLATSSSSGSGQNSDVSRYIHSFQSLLVSKFNGTLSTVNTDIPYRTDEICPKLECKELQKSGSMMNKPASGKRKAPVEYICEVCNFKCANRINYKSHYKLHEKGNQKNFACQYCDGKFLKKRSKDLHERRHTGKNIHKCNQCQEVFTKLYAYQRHKREVHVVKREIICAECSKAFSSERHLENHLGVHQSEKKHKCKQCNHFCQTASGLRTHVAEYHSNLQNRTFSCEMCNEKFKKQYGLKRHIQRKHSTKQFFCDSCPKKFACKEDLMQHDKFHSSQDNLSCNHCDKIFGSSWALQRHLRSHDSELRPFQCNKCPKSFTRKDSLLSHSKLHAQKKVHVCHCGKRFVKRSQMKAHQDKHSDYPKYTCDICKRSFKFKVSLKNHSCKANKLMESVQQTAPS